MNPETNKYILEQCDEHIVAIISATTFLTEEQMNQLEKDYNMKIRSDYAEHDMPTVVVNSLGTQILKASEECKWITKIQLVPLAYGV